MLNYSFLTVSGRQIVIFFPQEFQLWQLDANTWWPGPDSEWRGLVLHFFFFSFLLKTLIVV